MPHIDIQVSYNNFILPPNLNNNWMTAVIGWSRHVTGWTTLWLVGGGGVEYKTLTEMSYSKIQVLYLDIKLTYRDVKLPYSDMIKPYHDNILWYSLIWVT